MWSIYLHCIYAMDISNVVAKLKLKSLTDPHHKQEKEKFDSNEEITEGPRQCEFFLVG